jgi:hypothetical protein
LGRSTSQTLSFHRQHTYTYSLFDPHVPDKDINLLEAKVKEVLYFAIRSEEEEER